MKTPLSFPARTLVPAALFLFLFLFRPVPAGAKIYLDINAPTIRKLPLAVQIFRNLRPESPQTAVGGELHETLSDDLAFSGLFQVLDPTSFIEAPSQAETDPEKIHFEDWTAVGADALIQGTYLLDADRLRVEFHLYDVIQRKRIVGKRYYGALPDLRRMAHRFADEVVKQITGEEGAFHTRIVYLDKSEGLWQIHIMDYDGRNDHTLFAEKSILVSPKWSADGEKIVFTSYRAGNPDLYQITLRTAEVQKVSAEPGINTGGVYSPGGGRLALVLSKDGNPEIYLLEKYARKPRRLTRNWATDVAPSWSPDGKRIAFMSDRAGGPQIYVMEAGGGRARRITFQGSYNAAPAWSPRGDRIAFATLVDGHFQIATVKADGSDLMILTANAGTNEFPSWSPDGRFLCFASTMDGAPGIYIMNANGSNLRKIRSNSFRNSSPDWSPRIFFQ